MTVSIYTSAAWRVDMNAGQKKRRISLLLVLMFLLGGCATQSRYTSSTVDYLYPGSTDHIEKPSIPVMKIPMKVGIAFVPGNNQRRLTNFWQSFFGKSTGFHGLTEKQKTDLMQKAASYFQKYEFIDQIEIIPSAYLQPRGSFANLDQIRTMYNIDAIALIAYDQVQFTDEGVASFLYWTIIGAYIVPGEKNSTQTMMDAVVYDIKSRKMLFRAPGVSQVKGAATPVNLSEELRHDSQEGFNLASGDMIKNLDTQLALFKEKVKQRPKDYVVEYKPGYKGSGSLGWMFVGLLLLLPGFRWLFRSLA
jgi:rhombotail lipoprotein